MESFDYIYLMQELAMANLQILKWEPEAAAVQVKQFNS